MITCPHCQHQWDPPQPPTTCPACKELLSATSTQIADSHQTVSYLGPDVPGPEHGTHATDDPSSRAKQPTASDTDAASSTKGGDRTLPDGSATLPLDRKHDASQTVNFEQTVTSSGGEHTLAFPEADAAKTKGFHRFPTSGIPSDATAYSTIKGASAHANRTTAQPQPRVVTRSRTQPEINADYNILDQVGEGGMGTIYRAFQVSIQRDVAVKEIKTPLAGDERHRDSFSSEAAITGALDHPNIIPIHELGTTDDGRLFYSMKLVNGRPWDGLIASMSMIENVDVLLQVCDAIAFAHSRDVLHRDVKPENVMLGDFGEVLVMDWGLGTHFNEAGDHSPGGSPAYMAPEMAQHYLYCTFTSDEEPPHIISPASDVYLLGAILYEIVTGQPPHASNTALLGLQRAARNEFSHTKPINELHEIALKALATNPDERYESVLDLQNALRAYKSHAQSILLSKKAEEHLTVARDKADYNAFASALNGFQNALELWEENGTARGLMDTTRREYAQCALENGDFELGISLLDASVDEDRELQQALEEHKAERERRINMHRRLIRSTIGLLTALVVLSVGAAWRFNQLTALETKAKQSALVAKQAAESAQQQEAAARERAEEARRKEEQEREAAVAAQRAEATARQQAEAERLRAEEARQRAEQAQLQERRAKQVAETQRYRASISLVASLIKEKGFSRAKQELMALAGGDWEWGFLNYQTTVRQRNITPADHQPFGTIQQVSFSRSGHRLAMVSNVQGTPRLRIWDMQHWGSLSGNTLPSPSVSTALTAPPETIALSPDGTRLLIADDVGFRVQNLTTGQTRAPTLASSVTSALWLDDGLLLLGTLDEQGAAFVETWEHAAGNWKRSARYGHNTRPVRLLAARGPEWISACDYFVYGFSTRDGTSGAMAPRTQYQPLADHQGWGWISAVELLDNAAPPTALIGTIDGNLHRVPLSDTGGEVVSLSHQRARDSGSPPTLAYGGQAVLRNANPRPGVALDHAVTCLAVHPDGAWIAVGHRDGYLTFLSPDLERRQTLRPHLESIESCRFVSTAAERSVNSTAPPERWLLVSMSNDEMVVTDPDRTDTGTVPPIASAVTIQNNAPVLDAFVLEGTQRVATVDRAGQVRTWKPAAGKLGTYRAEQEYSVGHVLSGPSILPQLHVHGDADGTVVVTSRGASLCAWDLDTGRMLGRYAGDSATGAWDTADEGREIWLAPVAGRGTILRTANLQPLRTYEIPYDGVEDAGSVQWLSDKDGRRNMLLPLNASLRLLRSEEDSPETYRLRRRLQDEGFRSSSRTVQHAFAHPRVGLSNVIVSNGEESITWNLRDGKRAKRLKGFAAQPNVPVLENIVVEAIAVHDARTARWIARLVDPTRRAFDRFALVEYDFTTQQWLRHPLSEDLGGAWAVTISDDGSQVFALHREGQQLSAWQVATDLSGRLTRRDAEVMNLPSGAIPGQFRMQGVSRGATLGFVACLTQTLELPNQRAYQVGDGWYLERDPASGAYAPKTRFLSRRPIVACRWDSQDERIVTLSDQGDLRVWVGPSPHETLVAWPCDRQPAFDRLGAILLDHGIPGKNGHDQAVAGDGCWRLGSLSAMPATSWQEDSLAQLSAKRPHAACASIAPAHRLLALFDADSSTIRIYHSATGVQLDLNAPIAEHHDAVPVTTLRFAPSGDRMLAGYRDGRIAIFRMELSETPEPGAGRIEELLSFQAHRDSVRAIRFWDEGRHLLSTSDDGTARLWLTWAETP